MVASYYGINVGLPLQDISAALLLVLEWSMLLSVSAVAIFWRRYWF
jgi:Mg2+ and Co2+ transporter CorA